MRLDGEDHKVVCQQCERVWFERTQPTSDKIDCPFCLSVKLEAECIGHRLNARLELPVGAGAAAIDHAKYVIKIFELQAKLDDHEERLVALEKAILVSHKYRSGCNNE